MLSLLQGRWLASCIVVIAVALAARAPVLQPTRSPGFTYTVTAVQESPAASGALRADTTVSVEQFGDDYWRVDVRQARSSVTQGADSLRRAFGTEAGLYTLRKRGSSILTVVDTAKRQYFAYDLDSAMRSISRLNPERVPHAGDTAFATRVQPDTIVNGLHAQHWRLTSTLTLRVALLGEFTTHSTSDMYIATDAKDMRFGSPSEAQQSLLAGFAYSRELEQARAKLPHGLDVLSITQSVSDLGAGQLGPGQIASSHTMHLSDIRYIDIPAEVFVIPAGYQRVSPPMIPPFAIPNVRNN